MSDGPAPQSLRAAVADLDAGRVDAVTLVRRALAADVPGAIEVRRTAALDEAAAADRRRASGRALSALDGVPFGVKANLDVAGQTTTNGTGLRPPPAARDAAAVAALRAAGLVPALLTTQAEAAVGAVTDNPHTGPCPDPRRPTHHAGGSSGGSAAVVAAGAVPLALGSDTMGSVRIPAAYCGITGYKPGRSAIDTRGLVPLGGDLLDTVGVLASRPADVAVVADLLLGGGPGRPVVLAGAVVAVPAMAGLADEAQRAGVGAAAARLAEQGAEVRRGTGPSVDPGALRRLGLLACELTLLEEYDEAYRAGDPGLSSGLRRLLDFARDKAPRDVLLDEVRRDLTVLAPRLVDEIGADLVLLPVTPGPAPVLGEDPPDAADLTAWVNVAGLPAITVPPPPTGDPHAAPVQLVGRPGRDHDVLAAAVLLDGLSG